MNRLIKRTLFIISAFMIITLTACIGYGNVDDSIAGDDWRTYGEIVGNGAITHDGVSVDVLVTVSDESAAFYWDKPEQVLFDSVSFPVTVTDAHTAFNGISFDDINGDGESDVRVSFIHENGDKTEMIWIWDSVNRYVFREDLSSFVSGDSELNSYTGNWKYTDKELWLYINEDATWEFMNADGTVTEYGTLWADEAGITLHFDGSGDVLQLDRTVSGTLVDSVNGGTLIRD